jgi:hypothetical protein
MLQHIGVLERQSQQWPPHLTAKFAKFEAAAAKFPKVEAAGGKPGKGGGCC